ncbi:MAG: MarR family transcriptional regulator [Alphaproteobacteria bacterium]|nr:MarR family transcriptional regulator [Alphaproteobacteria bacterium]
MTTTSQRFCYVVDHLTEALGNDPSSSLRRAMILADIDQYPGSTQTAIMERLGIHKSALNREIEWLFNYGCITRQDCREDARSIRLETCGYSKKALAGALDYFEGNHSDLKGFLKGLGKLLKMEKPTLRDAKIVATLSERKTAEKSAVIASIQGGSASSDNRAFNKLVEKGLVEDV